MTDLKNLVPVTTTESMNSFIVYVNGNILTARLIITIAGFIVSICGIISNFFNIVIFWRLGLKDSMSVGLFALSFTDFLVTFLHTVLCLCQFTDMLYPTNPIDASELSHFAFGWAMNIVYLSSCWITATITVERCYCVVSPFRVKQVFTRSRCIIVILIIYVIHIGLHVPIYVLTKVGWMEFPNESKKNNTTTEQPVRVLTILWHEETVRVDMIFDITVSLALSDLSLTVVIVCTVWMIRSLKATSKVRTAPSMTTLEIQPNMSDVKLSYRERKLVNVAVTLAITLSVCCLPRIVVITVYNLMPNLNTGPFSDILWAVAYIFSVLGCSGSILVYLVLNSNYRAIFYRLLGLRNTR